MHREIVRLFDRLRPFLAEIEIIDEGEYWDTHDSDLLAQNLHTCAEMIRQAIAETPDARGPVRLPSGRWADVIS